MAEQQPPTDGFIKVNAPDGTVLKFPSSMGQQEILAVMRKRYPPVNQQQPQPPAETPPFPQAPPAAPIAGGQGPSMPLATQQEPQQPPLPQDGGTPIFVPGTESFATKSPLLPSQRPINTPDVGSVIDAGKGVLFRKVAEDPAKMQEYLKEEDKKAMQASYYLREYADMDKDGLEKRKNDLSRSASAIQAMAQEFRASEARLKEAESGLLQRKSAIDAMGGMDQEIVDSQGNVVDTIKYSDLVSKFDEDVRAFQKEYGALSIQADVIRGLARNAEMDQEAIARKEFDIKAGVGNRPAGVAYSMLNTAGKAISGTLEMVGKVVPTDQEILESLGLAPKGSGDASRAEWKQYLKDVEAAPTRVTGIDQFVTPEYIQAKKEDNIFDAGLFTLSEMAPSVAMSIAGGTPAMAATFFASSYRDAGSEMQGEYWDQIPEAEKEAIRIGVATVSAGLSTMGMQALASRLPVVNDIFFSAAKKMLPNMTAGQIRRLIDAETKSYVANLASKITQGVLIEGPEEGLDYLSEEAIKSAYENYKRGEFGDKSDTLFNNAESFNELADGLIENMSVGAVAGSMMGGSLAAVSSVGARRKLTNKEFNVFRSILADGSLRAGFESQAAADLSSGKIDRAEYDKVIDNLNVAERIISQIPEDLDIDATREAFDLLQEKAKLSKKDKALVGEKIAAIDQKLMELAGTKPKDAAGGEAKPATTATPATSSKLTFGEKPDKDADAPVWSSLSIGSVLTDSSDPNSHWVVVDDTTGKKSGDRVISLAIVEKEADGTWTAGPPSIIVSIGADGTLRTNTSPRYSYTDANGNRGMAIMQPSDASIPFGEITQEDAKTGERFTPQWAKDMAKIDEKLAALSGTTVDTKDEAARPKESEGRFIGVDGQEYLDIPRMRQFDSMAMELTSSLPPPPDGYTRLWRGNREGEVGSNPSFTRALLGIALPFQSVYGGPLSYVDVPTSDLAKYEQKGGVSPGDEFMLPRELASTAIVVQPQAEPKAEDPPTSEVEIAQTDGATATPTTTTQETVIEEGVPPASEGGAGVAEGQVGAEDGRQPSQTSVPESLTESPAAESPQAAPVVAEEPASPPQTPTPAEPKAQKEEGRPMRATAKRVIEQFPELENVLTDDAVYYNRMPHKVSLDAAKAIVEQRGLENAARDIMEGADMPGAVRSMLGRVIMETYRKEGKLEQLSDFSEKWFEGITNAAQAISALQTLYGDIYDKEAILFKAQKMVREQRIKQEKAAESTTRKLIKGLREVNKEAINETLGKVSVKGHITKASAPKKQSSESRKPRYGEKNRIVTRSAYEAALREMRSQMFSAIIPPQLVVMTAYHIEAGARSFAEVAEQLTKDLGRKALPYLKEAYKQASKKLKSEGLEFEQTPDSDIDEYIDLDPLSKSLEDFIQAMKSGREKDAERHIATIQSLSNRLGTWGEYKKYAADRLKRLSEQQIKKDVDADPYLMEFTRGLVANISQQIRDLDPDGKTFKKPARTSIEIIGDAFKNPEKYKEAWEETRKQFADELRGAKAELTKATESGDKERIAKAEARMAEREAKAEALDNYFGEFLPKPFSDALVAKAVSQGLKDLDIKIADIVRKHYTVQEGKKRELVDKLIQQAGLDGAEAAELAKAVGGEFDRIATEKKRQIIAKAFPVGERKKPSVRGVEQSLIELTNAGAFSDADVVKRYGDSMGFAKLTAEQISTIEGLADAIQRAPEGRPKWDAVQNLLDYQASIKGLSWWQVLDSVWYANVLGGPETQAKNIIANTANLIGEFAVASVRETFQYGSPSTTIGLAKAIVYGTYKGMLEGASVMLTGRSPIRSHKTEASAHLELMARDARKSIRRMAPILGKWKYFRRFMEAMDTITYEGGREMRAYQMAVKLARGNPNPDTSIRQRALDLMNANNTAIEQAKIQAELELEDVMSDIKLAYDAGQITKRQKTVREFAAKTDSKRRAFELVEQKRDEFINEESARFGSDVTFNKKATGALGVVVTGLKYMIGNIPFLNKVVPFTTVIANVANRAIDWTPVGFLRSMTDAGSITGEIGRVLGMENTIANERLTPEQYAEVRADMIARAAIGTSMMAAAWILSQPGDDGEEPTITITGNGYGDPRKNQQLRETGWQPYSIKIGDTWISYQYSPLILAFGVIGHLRDMEKYRRKKIDDTDWTNVQLALAATAPTFFDMSFLSGLSKSLSAMTDIRNEDKLQDFREWLTNTGKSFVVNNAYTQGFRIYQSIADEPNKDIRDSYAGQLLKDIPFVRDMYPDALNLTGEPVVPRATTLMSVENDDPVYSLFAGKGWMQGLPAAPPVYDPAQKKDRVMTPEERAVFYKERGEYIRKVVESNMDQLRKLDGEKFDKAMRSITSKATKRAKGKIVLGADYEPE